MQLEIDPLISALKLMTWADFQSKNSPNLVLGRDMKSVSQ